MKVLEVYLQWPECQIGICYTPERRSTNANTSVLCSNRTSTQLKATSIPGTEPMNDIFPRRKWALYYRACCGIVTLFLDLGFQMLSERTHILSPHTKLISKLLYQGSQNYVVTNNGYTHIPLHNGIKFF